MKQEIVQSKVSIAPRELRERLQNNIPSEILDVRTPPEFAAAHLPAARLIPLDDLDVQAFLANRKRQNHPLFVVCQSGNRARKAIEKFARNGFTDCILVEGGMEACIGAGLEVRRGATRVLPIMQQVQIVAGAVVFVGAALAIGVDFRFAVIPLLVGGGLVFAGLTGFCGLGLLLAKMPWNRRCEIGSAGCCQ